MNEPPNLFQGLTALIGLAILSSPVWAFAWWALR